MKKISTFITSLLILVSLVCIPVYVDAQVTGKSLGLFPCNGPDCNFSHAIDVVNAIVKTLFIAVLIVTPLLVVKAGYHFIIGGNKPAEREKGRNQLMNIAIGLVIIACSYAVVKLVLSVLINQTTIQTGF